MIWLPIETRIEDKLEKELISWKGTPYASGQRVKQVGVDCIRFVVGVLDYMKGSRTDFSALPCDAHLHAPEKAKEAMRTLLKQSPMERLDLTTSVEPGDVLVVGTDKAPGHAMIVGSRQNQLWHQDGHYVGRIGPCFGSSSSFKLYRIYRPNKELW